MVDVFRDPMTRANLAGVLIPFSSLLGRQVLTEDGRMHIANHKYRPGVYTPLDNVLNGWWYGITETLPRSLHPNLITFAGFLPIFITFSTSWYCSPTFDQPPPRWLCFMMAITLFVYQTLDAVDGKQARRIGQSTPLGQLFDHGCDCMACLSHHSMAAVLFLSGATYLTLAGLAVLQTGFFMAQWQEHYTGVLSTSFGPVGVTETQYGLISFALLAGLAGPDRVAAVMTSQVFGLQVGHFFVWLWILFNIVLMGFCFFKTFTHKSSHPHEPGQWVAPSIMKDHLDLNRVTALLDMLPIVFLNVVLLCCWHPDIVESMPRVLCLSAGLLFFYLTAQMIVFSMGCMEFNPFQPVLLPFAALAFASRFAYLPFEMFAVKVTLVVHTIVLSFYVMAWVLTVINELKAHLGIHIFTVGPPKKSD